MTEVQQEQPTEKVLWGDEDFEDEESFKIEIEYKENEKGQKVKVTKKIKVEKVTTRINKAVEMRKKNWVKFGLSETGFEQSNIEYGDAVDFVPERNEKKEKKFLEEQLRKEVNDAIARHNKMTTSWRSRRIAEESGSKPLGGVRVPTTDRYIPPSLRGGASTSENNTLLVTNISEYVSEDELRKLFGKFGGMTRFHLGKDRLRNKSKGFAFITYSRRENAEAAMEALHGYALDHLILNIEWAEERK